MKSIQLIFKSICRYTVKVELYIARITKYKIGLILNQRVLDETLQLQMCKWIPYNFLYDIAHEEENGRSCSSCVIRSLVVHNKRTLLFNQYFFSSTYFPTSTMCVRLPGTEQLASIRNINWRSPL